MSKVIDVRKDGGEVVVLGNRITLPSSSWDGIDLPVEGASRFNPTIPGFEVFSGGAWQPFDTAGTGAISAHNIPITSVVNLPDTLAGKSPVQHNHTIADVTHLQTTLDARSAIDHPESVATIFGLQAAFDDLTSNLATRSPIDHTHSTSQIAGLDATLATKSPKQHEHNLQQIIGQVATDPRSKYAQFDVAWQAYSLQLNENIILPICFKCKISSQFLGVRVKAVNWPSSRVRVDVRTNDSLLIGRLIFDRAGSTPTTQVEWFGSAVGLILNPGDFLTFRYTDNVWFAEPFTVSFLAERIA
jgi:hypothetical protein